MAERKEDAFDDLEDFWESVDWLACHHVLIYGAHVEVIVV